MDKRILTRIYKPTFNNNDLKNEKCEGKNIFMEEWGELPENKAIFYTLHNWQNFHQAKRHKDLFKTILKLLWTATIWEDIDYTILVFHFF